MRRPLVGSPISTSNTVIPAGTVVLWGSNTVPAGWLKCDGSTYAIATYPALYSAIGNTFGSSSPNFQVPNLSGRVPYGVSASRALNTTGGVTTVKLTAAQSALRNHTHPYGDYYNDSSAATSNAATGAGSNFNQTTANENTEYLQADAASAHTNIQPYIILHFIIKT